MKSRLFALTLAAALAIGLCACTKPSESAGSSSQTSATLTASVSAAEEAGSTLSGDPTTATALRVGSHAVTAAEFDYFYRDAYEYTKNSYGDDWSSVVDETKPLTEQEYVTDVTWADYFIQMATDNAARVYVLCDAAQSAGYALDAEAQSALDGISTHIDDAAKEAGFDDVDAYMADTYGTGCTKAGYLDHAAMEKLAEGYTGELYNSYTYTDDELRAYYDENADSFDTITYRLFTVDGSDDMDTAQKAASLMLSELDGSEQSFVDVCKKYAVSGQDVSDATTLVTYASASYISADYADWLYDPARKSGDSEMVRSSTDDGFALVMFLSRDNNAYDPANFRHIQVDVAQSGDNDTATDADWAACKESADALYTAWQSGDATEDSFAALADEQASGTSTRDGGLFEDVGKGDIIQPINDWLFSSGRKAGDTVVLQSEFGYHLIYFCGYSDTPRWKTLADTKHRSEDYNAWYEDASSDYEVAEDAAGMTLTKKNL